MDATKLSDTAYVIDGMTVAICEGAVDGMDGQQIDAYLRSIIAEARPIDTP
jgi:hypothetical protein